MSTLIPSLNAGISRVLVSYDIGCQWHKNLQARLNNYNASPPLKLAKLKYWNVVVPKFHLPGHGKKCQSSYNLAYTKWAGRMDGERIEAGWAQIAPMATWTRESGPNARRGILDDHWNAGNWRKTLRLRQYTTPLAAAYELTSQSRCIPRQEPSTITRMEQKSAGGCNSHLRELPDRGCHQVAQDAG